MTTIARPKELWNTMPGWGIVANLTPPELLAARKLRVIRKLLAVGLVLMLVIGAAGYTYAAIQRSAASGDLASEQARTAALQVQQRKYSGVVQIQGTITQVQSELAGLLKNDVDFEALLGQIRSRLPAGMTVGQLSVVLDNGAVSSATGGGAALDASGLTHIGTVTLSGTGTRLSDVSTYVDKLKTITGVVEPYPASNQSADAGVQYSVQLTLTDELLTHAHDLNKIGKK